MSGTVAAADTHIVVGAVVDTAVDTVEVVVLAGMQTAGTVDIAVAGKGIEMEDCMLDDRLGELQDRIAGMQQAHEPLRE